MIYKIIQPSLHLQSFVKEYLILHCVFDISAPVPVKPFPANTLQCLVFYVKGFVTAYDPQSGISKFFPQTAINGSIISRLDFRVSHDYLLLSVGFHPGALSKFQVGEEILSMKNGDTLFIPRTVKHCFTYNGKTSGTLLVNIFPAKGMENYFLEMGKLLTGKGMPDMAAMQTLFKSYDSEILGPPMK